MIAAGCGKRSRLTGRGVRGLARAVGLFVVVAIAVSCEGDSGSSVVAPSTPAPVAAPESAGGGSGAAPSALAFQVAAPTLVTSAETPADPPAEEQPPNAEDPPPDETAASEEQPPSGSEEEEDEEEEEEEEEEPKPQRQDSFCFNFPVMISASYEAPAKVEVSWSSRAPQDRCDWDGTFQISGGNFTAFTTTDTSKDDEIKDANRGKRLCYTATVPWGKTASTCVSIPAQCSAPSMPGGFTLRKGSDGKSFLLKWSAVTKPEGCTSIDYEVRRGSTVIATKSGTTHTDANLASGEYCYTVVAIGSPGSHKSKAARECDRIVPPCTTPSKPTGLSVSLGSDGKSLDVEWKAVTKPEGCKSIDYKVRRGSTVIATESGTTHTDANLASGKYCYTVAAIGSPGNHESAPSTEKCDTIPPCTAPSKPEGLQVTLGSENSLVVKWKAVAKPEGCKSVSYEVRRGSTVIATESGTTHTDPDLKPGEYCYTVLAIAGPDDHKSVPSTERCRRVPDPPSDPPDPPKDFDAEAESDTVIELTWRHGAGATSYEIQWREEGAANYGSRMDVGKVLTHRVTGLAAATRYEFQARSVGDGGKSKWVDASATTKGRPRPPEPDPEPDPEPPTTGVSAPSNLTATAASSSAMDLSWSAVSGATGYEVRWRASGGSWGNWSSESGTSRRVSGLSAGTSYEFEVRAVKGSTRSSASSVSGRTEEATGGAPTGFAATALSQTEMELSWDRVAGATTYELRWRGEGGAWSGWTATGLRSHWVSGLEADTGYEFEVRAVFTGTHSASARATGRTKAAPVGAPGGLAAVASSWSAIRFTWDAVTGADRYEFQVRTGSGSFGEAVEKVGSGTSHAATGLAGNSRYCGRVRARKGATGQSEWTGEACATTEVEPPSGLSVKSPATRTMEVSWTGVTGADSYELRRKKGEGDWGAAYSAGSGTVARESGLTGGAEYCYEVRTVAGGSRSGWTVEKCATARALMLGVPEDLAATAESASRIRLTWGAVSEAEEYELERRRSGSAKVAVIPVTGTAHVDDGALGGTAYSYRVRSVAGSGVDRVESAWSEPVPISTPAAGPVSPTDLEASAVSPVEVDLEWNGVLAATGYEVRYRAGSGSWSAEDVGTARNSKHAGLDPGTDYELQVRAWRGTAKSDWSESATVTTPELGVPSGLTAKVTDAGTVTLGWVASAGAGGYELERRRSGSAKATLIPVTGREYEEAGLAAETEYGYRVRAVLVRGASRWESGWSASVEVTTPAAGLQAPGGVTGEAVSSVRVDLDWDSVEGADSYEWRWRTAELRWTDPESSGSATRATLKGLTPETGYEVRVRALAGTERSEWSEGVTVTTKRLAAPGGLKATATSSSRIRLEWNGVKAAGSYEMERRRTGSTETTVIGLSGRRREDRGLRSGTRYRYRVRSVLARGGKEYRSGWSRAVTATTERAALSAPAGVSAAAESAFGLRVKWEEVAGAKSYEVRWREEGESDFESGEASGTELVVDGLAPETEYEVQVRGVRGAGEAPVWSVGVSVKTLVFAAPRRFRVSARGAGSVRAAWEAEAGLRYVLGYRAKGARQWTELTMKQGPRTVRGLKADTAYRFRLLAEKASGGEIHRSALARAEARTLAASGSEEDE